jgi:hypothetical protein
MKITMMVLLVYFKEKVQMNLRFVFFSLPVTLVPGITALSSKKEKMPITGKSGDIVSIRYENFTRGISKPTTPWKNAVSMDMCVGDHNVNIKFSNSSLHISGARSIDDGYIVSRHLQNMMNDIMDSICYLRSIDTLSFRLSKFKEKSISDKIAIFCGDTSTSCHLVNIPDESFAEDENDLEILNFLTRYPNTGNTGIYEFYEDYWAAIDNLLLFNRNHNICNTYDQFEDVDVCTANANSSIGFRLDIDNLYMLCHDLGYVAIPSTRLGCLKVEIPYDGVQNERMNHNKKVQCTTIQIYRNGKTTHSSPDLNTLYNTSEEFLRIITNHRSRIELLV